MYSRIYTRLPWFFDYIGEPEDDILLGDINFDETINVSDIVMVVNFVLGNSTPSDDEFIASDMNVDGILNILDVKEVVNIILGSNDLARTVEWLEKNFPELQVKERLNKLNIDWKKKKTLGN